MKVEDIFDSTCVKTQQMLSKRLFHIQLRKSSWTNSNVTYTSKRNIKMGKLFNEGYVEMKSTFIESESSSNGTSIEPPMLIKKL
ncbi:hypothetical protein R3W88_029556 [Solanum pinnatisectum]|uniref:Uncharacterized protein n=1 Tax=Solanum pinnatisectum TaxID=50273 RepID=A0AAV9K5N2_9SOLN|nr:hypothetical protein R3W88_029556 [Solanum pinnatisectum]